MALLFVLDEHLRGLHRAVVRHNVLGGLPIDVVCVGDPEDLPLGSADPSILEWAERAGRVVVTLDTQTMPDHLAEHLRQGKHSSGVLVLNANSSWAAMVDYLELVAHAGTAEEFADAVRYGP